MKNTNTVAYLFEVSWEVCNKVGGIYTVLTTKAKYAVEHFDDRYFLIGPDLGNNPEFEETDEEPWGKIRDRLKERGLVSRCGRWNIPGRPRVILVNHNNKYDQGKLLFRLWQDFGVDSITGGWDYIEPVIFSTAAGEVIETLHEVLNDKDGKSIAQFHEWMTGAGLLYIKSHVPEIGTIFTTHATMLGRTLSSQKISIYNDMAHIAPSVMASRMNIVAKHSMESACARECDCLSTVSEPTAKEVTHFLGRSPDIVLPNGINIDDIPDLSSDSDIARKHRAKIISFASKFLQIDLEDKDTRVLMTSGRYEFHNKGIDIFLEALSKINNSLKKEGSKQHILCFFCVIAGHMGISREIQEVMKGKQVQRSGISRICTHQLQDPQHDPIWNACQNLNLLNTDQDRVHVIFMPVYLDGYDGLLNMKYYDVLSGCNMGVFPSVYEPWGYTPLESCAYSVTTVTTDISGFGVWVNNHFPGENKGVILLNYNRKSRDEIVSQLTKHITNHLRWTAEDIKDHKIKARFIANKASWKEFYPIYLNAYSIASKTASKRQYLMDTSAYKREAFYPGRVFMKPKFRSLSVFTELPDRLKDLWDIAYNLWWTWNPEYQEVFERISPKIWDRVLHNPIELLQDISPERMKEISENESYLRIYGRVVDAFDEFLKDSDCPLRANNNLTRDNPIAYFSLEYGLHECLPIYAGGLGILSGDHLKSASDLNIPMVAVGLLYKCGYFKQVIDKEGNQVDTYLENDFSRMPVRVCTDAAGEPVKISVNLPGRTVYARAWKINVGRTTLYLLDTSVPENSKQDMEITSRLYDAEKRLRIEQEIMLGIGGIRLLDKLGIKPSIYHLNEGHSAFLLIERIRKLTQEQGLSFHEAREVVKASSVFTVHTPVEAGKETFELPLIKHYFADYLKEIPIDWDTFWELGRDEPGEEKPFVLSVLALKLCCESNGVSRLHGKVSRKLWKNVWSGFEESEIPIKYITNGVHMQTWTAPEIRQLLETYAGIDFYSKEFWNQSWDDVINIPDNILWQRHMELKTRMIEYLKKRLASDLQTQGVPERTIQKKLSYLNPSALTIVFARRFASYKRPQLIFKDLERIQKILGSKERPVQVIFAGKAHPNDGEGKRILKEIYSYSMDERFMNSVFLLQNYDMESSRYLVQGSDVWLNNPLRPYEASGTSGMKAAANGVLNLSILDGWWDEAFNGENGWAIGDGKEYPDPETQDLSDAVTLYDILENSVIPMYYTINSEGIPEQWVEMIKESIKTIVPVFNTHTMLQKYYNEMYSPVATRAGELSKDNFERARALAQWKREISSRFSTVNVKWYSLDGISGDSLKLGDEFRVDVGVELGKLTEDELKVELVIGEPEEGESIKDPFIVSMTKTGFDTEKGLTLYTGRYRASKPGKFVYGIRVLPSHPDLLDYQELGLVYWV